MKMAIAVLLALVLGACTGRILAPTPDQSLDGDYTGTGFSWTGGTIVYVFLAAKPVGTETAVCGAYTITRDTGAPGSLTRQVLDAATVRIAGERLLTGVGYFPRVKFVGEDFEDYLGARTGCRLTGTPWRTELAGAKVELGIPHMQFRQ